MPKPFAFFIRILNPDNSAYLESQQLAQGILEPICMELKLDLVDGTDYGTGRISEQVLAGIRDADVVFADANDSNENIWYEIGYAHSINRDKVVYLFKRGRKLPFDIRDFRGFEYENRPVSLRELEVKLRKTLKEILTHSTLFRLLRSDHWASAIPEYMSIHSDFRDDFLNYLKETALNIDHSPECRRRAMHCLLELDYVDQALYEHLSNPLVETSIREALFHKIAELNVPIPLTVLENGLREKKRTAILRPLAYAAASQWVHGYLKDDYFCQTTIRNTHQRQLEMPIMDD